VGKTTAKELVAAVLAQRYTTLKNPGNLNNELGLPLTLLKLEPDSERAVLEMAMYDLGEIALLAEIARPAVGVVTNVGPTHLERLGTIERIAQAKAELVQALPSKGVAILNGDDPRVRAMGSLSKVGRVLTYGLGSDVDLRATDAVALGFSGVRFDLHYQGETISAQTSLLGLHSVHTAMAAAAVGIAEGLTWPEILSGLADPDARVRLKPLSGRNGSTVLDDTYNSSPASSLAALGFLQGLPGRKIAVLGDMLELGSFEEAGHRKVGAAAAEVVTALVTVGSLGRIIGQAAVERGMASDAVHTCDDNQAAAAEVKGLLKPGDVVLVKGSRGMAMEEIVAELAEEGES
jgi:UDP-N-acetylmuramoyl-tripeptide--D-alanyl-D-alanine ligase